LGVVSATSILSFPNHPQTSHGMARPFGFFFFF